jgi:hypothetical protein
VNVSHGRAVVATVALAWLVFPVAGFVANPGSYQLFPAAGLLRVVVVSSLARSRARQPPPRQLPAA